MHHSLPCMCSQFPKRCVHTLESVERFGGVLTVRTRLIPVSLRAYMCVLCAACVFGRGERDKEKRRQSFLWRQPLISVPLCTCVCMWTNPWCLGGRWNTVPLSGAHRTPTILLAFSFTLISASLYPSLIAPPPQPLFVTTAILKAIHAAPRLSSCIAAFSPAPRFLFFFFLKPFIRLEQTGVDGGRTGEVACCCALSLCQMDAAWRCREDGGFGCYER